MTFQATPAMASLPPPGLRLLKGPAPANSSNLGNKTCAFHAFVGFAFASWAGRCLCELLSLLFLDLFPVDVMDRSKGRQNFPAGRISKTR